MRGRNSGARAGEPYRTLTPPRMMRSLLPVGMPGRAALPAVLRFFAHPPPRLRVCRVFRSLFRKFRKILGVGPYM